MPTAQWQGGSDLGRQQGRAGLRGGGAVDTHRRSPSPCTVWATSPGPRRPLPRPLPPCRRRHGRGKVVPAAAVHRQALPAGTRPDHRVRTLMPAWLPLPPLAAVSAAVSQHGARSSNAAAARSCLGMQGGVWRTHDLHRWQADQAADLGHGVWGQGRAGACLGGAAEAEL